MNCNVSREQVQPYLYREAVIAPRHRRKALVFSARAADALLALVGSIACAAAALLSTAGFFSP